MSIMAALEAQSAAEAAAAELRQMSPSPNPAYGRDFAIERRVSYESFTLTGMTSSCPDSLLKTTQPLPRYPWVSGGQEGRPQ